MNQVHTGGDCRLGARWTTIAGITLHVGLGSIASQGASVTKAAKTKKFEDPKPGAPTPAESALADEWKSANEGKIRPLCVKASKNAAGTLEIRPDHPGGDMVWAALLMRSMGTKNEQAAQWLLNALTNAAVSGGSSRPSESDLNGALSVLQEIAPRDEIEAMLVSQMIATHSAIASQARMLRCADMAPQLEATGSLLTKLQRTFTTQLEALQRYRGKAPQQVRVEHVHVHEGGQAIVGTVQAGGGEQSKSKDQPHAPALTYAPGEALPSAIQALGEALPIPRR